MQKKYQRHRRYCPSQTLNSSPEQISLDIAPDLSHRDHSPAIVLWVKCCKPAIFSLHHPLWGSISVSEELTSRGNENFLILHQNITCLLSKGLISKDIGSNYTCLSVVWDSCYSSSKLGQNWPIYLHEQLDQTELVLPSSLPSLLFKQTKFPFHPIEKKSSFLKSTFTGLY